MLYRALLGIAIALGCVLAPMAPSLAQAGALEIEAPAGTKPVAGLYTFRWRCNDLFDQGIRSVTWYYATDPDSPTKSRVVTSHQDNFTNFRRSWRTDGPFGLDWTTRNERGRGRSVLVGPRAGGPLISIDPVERDSVISLLARPTGLRNEFGIGFRIRQANRGFEVRNNQNTIRLVSGGEVLDERQLVGVRSQQWFWYEIGSRTRGKDVEIRVRVYDEKRERLLVNFTHEHRPTEAALLQPGLVALWGPADFAELFVDPWSARWLDDEKRELRWNTRGVPDGDYYLIAELVDGNSAPQYVVSPFQVEVRNRGQSATN
jgi:hypothetical protein